MSLLGQTQEDNEKPGGLLERGPSPEEEAELLKKTLLACQRSDPPKDVRHQPDMRPGICVVFLFIAVVMTFIGAGCIFGFIADGGRDTSMGIIGGSALSRGLFLWAFGLALEKLYQIEKHLRK